MEKIRQVWILRHCVDKASSVCSESGTSISVSLSLFLRNQEIFLILLSRSIGCVVFLLNGLVRGRLRIRLVSGEDVSLRY
jgi:hypothetical protein